MEENIIKFTMTMSNKAQQVTMVTVAQLFAI